MVEEGQDIFVGALLQDAAARFDGELGIGIEGEMPVGVGELEGLVKEVDDMEQAFASGFDEQTGVAKRVTGEVDHGDAGRDFVAGAGEAEFVLQGCEAFQVRLILRRVEGGPARDPFVPLRLRRDVACIGKGELSIGIGQTSDVVAVEVRQIDDVDIGGRKAQRFESGFGSAG